MKELLQTLRDHGVGRVEGDVSLAEHTTYRVGGPAAVLVQPAGIEELATAIRLIEAAGAPRAVIGWGSNLIASDDGFAGVVIKLGEAFRYVRAPQRDGPDGERVSVTVGAATMNGHLVRDLHRAGLSGAEFLALIPGTFGGAVVMNAGTKQGEVVDIAERVKVVTRRGEVKELSAETLHFRYRGADIPDGAIVVEGAIGVRRGGVDEGRERVRAEREHRNRTQPYTQPSAGSVFKNPAGDYAGRLIEAAGLKGRRLGGAQISTRHANFIVTEPGAKAADILGLMALARREVEVRFGVRLESEQHLLGFAGEALDALLDRLGEEWK